MTATAADLWPSFTRNGHTFIQFQNGAFGLVKQLDDGFAWVEFWNHIEDRVDIEIYPTSSSGTGRELVIRPNHGKFSRWLGTAGRVVGGPLVTFATTALAPSDLAVSGVCSNLDELVQPICERDMSINYCDAFFESGTRWGRTETCLTLGSDITQPLNDNWGTDIFFWQKNTGVGNAATLWDSLYYPERVEPRPTMWGERTSVEDVLAQLPDPYECVTTSPETCNVPEWTPEKVDELEVGRHPELHDGSTFLPDIWEPLPMPEGFENATPREMNPGGTMDQDQTTAPTLDVTVTPWPAEAPTQGTGTVTDNGDGTQSVNIELPDPCGAPGQPSCSVTVENFPEYTPPPMEEVEIPVETFDLSVLQPGDKWLPDECPEPLEVDVPGGELTLPYDNACTVFGWVGLVIQALGALSAALIVSRGVSS